MKRTLIVGAFAVVAIAAAVKFASARSPQDPGQQQREAHGTSIHNPAPVAIPSSPSSDPAVERGRYLAVAGDCVACHSVPGSGQPFAGGYRLETPFGALLSSNITQDKETGIGSWTQEDLANALRKGKGKRGENLYPAMPYTAYAKLTDEDVADLYAYLKTIPPVHNPVQSNQLPFPFNIRLMMSGWNLLFFDDAPLVDVPGKNAEWHRGRYLAEALEHCAACHTPKNLLGGDASGKPYQGAVLQGWFAPNITSDPATGIGGWSDEQLLRYLRQGNNDLAAASGPMAEAVINSTQYLTDTDLRAMVAYLRDIPGPKGVPAQPLPLTDPRMVSGQRVFSANCVACHTGEGTGIDQMIAGFKGRPAVLSPHVESLLNSILMGSRGAATAQSPTGAGMPAFDWKLSDQQIANVLTYLRNAWGNAAEPVSIETVSEARKALGAQAQLQTMH